VTSEVAVDPLSVSEPAPTPLPAATRRRIILYLAGLFVLLGFASPAGGLIGLPISFFLKNKLHLMAHQLALFGLISQIPVYLAFAFGFARDTWNPFGMRDRGFLILFGSVSAGICLLFAFIPPTYGVLLVAVLLLFTSYLFIESALKGLTSTIGQQHVMSGQVSAAWNIFASLPGIAALLAGGLLSDMLEGGKAAQGARTLFFIAATIMASIGLYGLWKPASVFQNVHSERPAAARPLDDLMRLLRHGPVYPALLIWLLWQFVPGMGTPLQYFLQNTLHATDAQCGLWSALYFAGFIPTYILFGVLCRRYPLRTLLLWGTIVALPMMLPLLIIHGVTGALVVAAPIGLVGGLGGAAYLDLIIRSCPHGLQGTVLMAAAGLLAIDGQFGNVLGTALYDHFHDFTACVIAITATNALILPALLLVPKRLTATADGQTLAP
jgi:Na+/melibiose symporter-like transporter